MEFFKSFHIIELFRNEQAIFSDDGKSDITAHGVRSNFFDKFNSKHCKVISNQIVKLLQDEDVQNAAVLWWSELEKPIREQDIKKLQDTVKPMLAGAVRRTFKDSSSTGNDLFISELMSFKMMIHFCQVVTFLR